MANTMIYVINEVLRATQQRPNKTAVSDTDSTAFILDKLNEALENIYGMSPTGIDVDATLTLPASTRTVAIASGLDPYRIYDWSWAISKVTGDTELEQVTEQYIQDRYPDYETGDAAEPRLVYFSGGEAAFYPLLEAGASSLTIQYKYPTQFVKLAAATDTFPFPDRSDEMAYIKFYAQAEYEIEKGLGAPDYTLEKAATKRARLKGKYARGKRIGFKGYRRYA